MNRKCRLEQRKAASGSRRWASEQAGLLCDLCVSFAISAVKGF